MMAVTSAQAFPTHGKSPKPNSISVHYSDFRGAVHSPTPGDRQSHEDCHTWQDRTYRTSGSTGQGCLSDGYYLSTTITVVGSFYWIIRLQRERAISPRDYEIKRRRFLNNQPAHFPGPVDGKVFFFTRVGDAGRLKASFPDLGVKLNNTGRQEERHMKQKNERAE